MKKVIIPAILVLALGLPTLHASIRKLEGKFTRADINNDNRLTPLEFRATQGKKLSVAFSLFRFQKTDTNGDGFVSLSEFQVSRGGNPKGKPTKLQLFLLADEDRDQLLDPTEYASTLSPGLSWPKVLKSFDKRDKSDDGLLSPREFGISRFPF